MNKIDILEFAEHSERNLVELHEDLVRGTYRHGAYVRFFVHDPKLRPIAKASVRDRVLHHAICRVIGPKLDRAFIFDSYASRKTKGTHAANNRLNDFAQKLSQNGTRTVWLLKCDVRKFFDSVDHGVLMELCRAKITDASLLELLANIIGSFKTRPSKGIPLGNLTSQLFANMYLDPLDQYVKRELRCKCYIRYTDDFVFLSYDRKQLEQLLPLVTDFLRDKLLLDLHPGKISFRRWNEGADFLGFVHFPNFRIVRPKTARRMFLKLSRQFLKVVNEDAERKRFEQVKQSYLGVLSHARSKLMAYNVRRNRFCTACLPNAGKRVILWAADQCVPL